ncbi:MAG: hypothetical protein R2755_29425 [Acidimicrobiales bacterium]
MSTGTASRTGTVTTSRTAAAGGVEEAAKLLGQFRAAGAGQAHDGQASRADAPGPGGWRRSRSLSPAMM